jgi:hypothetical protein
MALLFILGNLLIFQLNASWHRTPDAHKKLLSEIVVAVGIRENDFEDISGTA